MLAHSPCLLSINNYFYPRGGAEVVFLEQNRLFEELGWHVVPFAMHHAKNLPTLWSDYFPDEIEFGADYSFGEKLTRAQRVVYSRQARQKISDLLDLIRPRVAHAHNIYHHLSPSILSPLNARGIPVVLTIHDLKLACPAYTMMSRGLPCERCRGGKIHNVVVNRCMKDSLALSSLIMIETAVHRLFRLYEGKVAKFVAPSRFILEKFVQWGWARERLVHIPNFVDIDRFRSDTPIGERFLYCGRLSKDKGAATLLTAAAIAHQPVTFVGTGPDEDMLRNMAVDCGADAIFLGHQTGEALVRTIQSARALVLPSEVIENAPLTILEAYAAGRPVIGARIGGVPELVRENETGVLFQGGNADALAAALDGFAALDDAKLADMGAAGRRWAEEDFSATRYRSRLVELYDSLAGVSA